MTEMSNLGTNASPAATDYLVAVSSLGTTGIPAVLTPVAKYVGLGLQAQTSLGTISLSGTDTVAVSHGGTVYLATVSEIVAAGGGAGGGLPHNAPLVSTNAGGTATATSIGDGLSLTGGVLSASDVLAPFNDTHFGTLTGRGCFLRWILGQDYVAPAGTPDWIVSAGVTATAAATLTLSQNGTLLTTGTIAAGGNEVALSVGPGFTGSRGDLLEGLCTLDATLADIATLLTFGTSTAPTTWNPFDKNAGIDLSSDDLTATFANTGSFQSVRSSSSRSAGLLYFEATIQVAEADTGLGLALSTESLSAYPGAAGAKSVGYNTYSYGVYFNGIANNFSPHPGVGDVICVCVKLGSAPDLWVRINGNSWNGDPTANPDTGAGGMNDAALFNGALTAVLAGSVFVMGAANNTAGLTANFGGSAFAFTPPSTATAWG